MTTDMNPASSAASRVSSLRKAAFDGMVWGVGGKLLLIVANFAVLMVTSRVLSQVEFGVFAAATIFTDLAWALATSTFGVAIVQKKELSEQSLTAGFVAFAAMGLALMSCMALGAPIAERFLNAPGLNPVMIALSLLMPFKLLSGFYGAVLQRRLDMRYYQLTQNLPQILGGTGITIVAALLGFGVWALVIGFAVTTLLEFAMTASRVRLPRKLPRSLLGLGELWSVGSASAVNRMTNFMATNADRLIAGASFGVGPLGVYTRAYSLMMTPVKLLGLAASRVFLPVFSRMQHDESRLRYALERVLAAQTMIYLPIGIGCLVSTPVLVYVILGRGWHDVVPVAEILFIALFARLGYVVSEAAAIAIGEAWGAVRRQAAYAIAVVTFGGAGTRWGVVGLACGVTAALILFYVLSLRQSCRRFGCSGRIIARAHLQALGIGLICAAPALSISALPITRLGDWQKLNIPGAGIFWICYSLLVLFGPNRLWGTPFAELRASVFSTVAMRLPLASRRRSRATSTSVDIKREAK